MEFDGSFSFFLSSIWAAVQNLNRFFLNKLFADFFNHKFIRQTQQQPAASPPPLPVPNAAVRLSSPPKTVPVASTPSPAAEGTDATAQNNNTPDRTSPEEADDFVLVPSPSQLHRSRRAGAGNRNNVGDDSSAEPIPVPSQRGAFLKVSLFFSLSLSLAAPLCGRDREKQVPDTHTCVLQPNYCFLLLFAAHF